MLCPAVKISQRRHRFDAAKRLLTYPAYSFPRSNMLRKGQESPWAPNGIRKDEPGLKPAYYVPFQEMNLDCNHRGDRKQNKTASLDLEICKIYRLWSRVFSVVL